MRREVDAKEQNSLEETDTLPDGGDGRGGNQHHPIISTSLLPVFSGACFLLQEVLSCPRKERCPPSLGHALCLSQGHLQRISIPGTACMHRRHPRHPASVPGGGAQPGGQGHLPEPLARIRRGRRSIRGKTAPQHGNSKCPPPPPPRPLTQAAVFWGERRPGSWHAAAPASGRWKVEGLVEGGSGGKWRGRACHVAACHVLGTRENKRYWTHPPQEGHVLLF